MRLRVWRTYSFMGKSFSTPEGLRARPRGVETHRPSLTPYGLPNPMLRLLARKAPIDSSTPEEALVERAKDGESEAFKALFERHVSAVRRFLRDVMRDAALA